jgi:nucleotide-binding universal stress UspA family protein
MKLPKVNIKHILYATDDSEDARYAFTYAICFAKQFNAKLTLLHVVPEFPDMIAFDFGIERSVAAKKWFSVKKDYIQKIKGRFKKMVNTKCDGESINIHDIVVEKGNPVNLILKFSEERKCDLIVMGKKGRTALEDAMMGDTVRRVLRRSKLPVLVVQPKKKKKN